MTNTIITTTFILYMRPNQSYNECIKQLNDAFGALTPLTDKTLNEINKIFELKYIPKHTHLVKAGQVVNKIWFLNRGLLRSYFYKDDNECTTWFMTENFPFTNYRSFITQQPSLDNIITVEDSIVLETTRQNVYEIYAKYSDANTLGRIFAELYFLRHDAHVYDLLFSSAEDRYIHFLERMPGLDDRVKSKDLASYLGMTKETISRLKSKRKIAS
ncbi:MAG: Crp/Fnr family transcriptional regulator [Cytophagales bacterium]|nr:Crp/Fnr family transcriptional regulator [Cytophagales bacterium]